AGPRPAGRVHSGRGPGALRRQRPAPAGGFARADERGAAQGRGDAQEGGGRRIVPDDRRLRCRHQHVPAELRQHLRPPQAVGGAARRVAARARHHAQDDGAAGDDPGGDRVPVQHPDHLWIWRLYRVYVQAEADYRRKASDIGDVYVRSKTTNTMIPLSTLVTITSVTGTEITTRFNLLRSVEINGAPARGVSSGQALAALED